MESTWPSPKGNHWNRGRGNPLAIAPHPESFGNKVNHDRSLQRPPPRFLLEWDLQEGEARKEKCQNPILIGKGVDGEDSTFEPFAPDL